MYRPQTNSPVPSNAPPATLNKSPHGSNPGGLYPPSAAPSSNSSMTPSLQQQRSPAGSVPSPSPAGPMASSISPHSNPSNPAMNKTPTPQPPPTHMPNVPQQRPYMPSQPMMQNQPNRVMNGNPMDHQTSGYMQSQAPYMSQQGQPHPGYAMQQNGYGHHPNGAMQPHSYPMYHQQPSKNNRFNTDSNDGSSFSSRSKYVRTTESNC